MHCIDRLSRWAIRYSFIFSILPALAQATTFTVNALGEPASIESKNCAATCTLRDAINASASGDIVQFDPKSMDGKTVILTLFSNIADETQFGPSAFFITGNKALTIDATVNGLAQGVTIARSSAAGTAHFRLFDVDTRSTLSLHGLALQNGSAQGGDGGGGGGGALGAGGAIFNRGSLTLERCTVSGNRANGGSSSGVSAGGGGGVGGPADGRNGGGPNVGGVGGMGGGGGGMGGEVGGLAGGFGGGGGGGGGGRGGPGGFGGGGGGGFRSGIAGFGGGGGGGARGDSGGFGGGGGGMGGAIFNDVGTVSVTNTTFFGNTASGGIGGGEGSAVGSGYGGALFNYNGSLTLNFVTLSGNIVIAGPDSFGNRSSVNGGAIYSLGDSQSFCEAGDNPCPKGSSATMKMNYSIAANSIGGNDVVTNARNDVATISSGTGNLIMTRSGSGGFGGTGINGTVISTANPNLGPLATAYAAANGFGITMVPQAGSPAINRIACPTSPATDQRGFARPQGAKCDIGAVEAR